MYKKILSFFVVSLVLFSILPTIASSDSSKDIKTYYTIKIDNRRKTVTVEATFEDVRKDEVVFRFYGYGSYRYTETPATFKILGSSGSIIEEGEDWWKMKVGGNRKIYVKYKIEYDLSVLENYDHPCGIDTNLGLFCAQDIFAIPTDDRQLMERRVRVTFDIPHNWDIVTTYEKINDTTFEEKNLYELNRTIFEMGKIRFSQTGRFYGLDTTYTIFEAPKDFETDDRGLDQTCILSHSWDLDFKKDAEMIMKETAYFTDRLSKKFDIHTPNRVNIAAATRCPWWGWWHYETPYRADHTAHHQVCFYADRTVSFSDSLFWGIVNYYDTLLAAEYTGEKRYLGKIYLRYLLYKRGLKERLKKNDDLYDCIIAYAYGPIVLLHLNEEIQVQTNGKKSLDDVYSYILEEYKYGNLNRYEFITSIKSSTGIDFSEFFSNHVYGDYEIPVDEHAKQYKDDFGLHLDFHRRNSGAPDILYYTFIEIAADKGNPEHDPYLQSPYLDIDYFYTEKEDWDSFIKDLKIKGKVTETEFIGCLNKYTNNSSNDFFEFYSEYSPRSPSIDALNYWLDGKYDLLVRKELYVERTIKKLDEMIPYTSSYQEEITKAKELFNEYKTLLNNDNFGEAEQKLSELIETLEDIRTADEDEDDVPDVYEISHNLDPQKKDSDDDGIPDRYEINEIEIDGFPLAWQNIAKKSKNGSGFFEELEATADEEYLYLHVKYSKPFYGLRNTTLEFMLDFDGNWGTDDDRESFEIGGMHRPFLGAEMATNGLDDYIYIGKSDLEFKIPLETLEILRVPETFSLKVWAAEAIEYQGQEGWDTVGDIEITIDLQELERNAINNIEEFCVVYGNNTVDKEPAQELSDYYNLLINTEKDFTDFGTMILIGGPVANPKTKEFMTYFPVGVNNDYPGKGKGVIEVTKIGDKTYVLLAGSDRDGTRAAVEIFKRLGYIPSIPIIVDWNDGNPKIVEE